MLTNNGINGFSPAIISVSGTQCGEKASYVRGTWLVFECPPGTRASQVQLEKDNYLSLIFCGIEVVERDALISFEPEFTILNCPFYDLICIYEEFDTSKDALPQENKTTINIIATAIVSSMIFIFFVSFYIILELLG